MSKPGVVEQQQPLTWDRKASSNGWCKTFGITAQSEGRKPYFLSCVRSAYLVISDGQCSSGSLAVVHGVMFKVKTYSHFILFESYPYISFIYILFILRR